MYFPLWKFNCFRLRLKLSWTAHQSYCAIKALEFNATPEKSFDKFRVWLRFSRMVFSHKVNDRFNEKLAAFQCHLFLITRILKACEAKASDKQEGGRDKMWACKQQLLRSNTHAKC